MRLWCRLTLHSQLRSLALSSGRKASITAPLLDDILCGLMLDCVNMSLVLHRMLMAPIIDIRNFWRQIIWHQGQTPSLLLVQLILSCISHSGEGTVAETMPCHMLFSHWLLQVIILISQKSQVVSMVFRHPNNLYLAWLLWLINAKHWEIPVFLFFQW